MRMLCVVPSRNIFDGRLHPLGMQERERETHAEGAAEVRLCRCLGAAGQGGRHQQGESYTALYGIAWPHHLTLFTLPMDQVLKYFSYEHFYVIYCKFWELDTDHDFFIDRNDLAHYGQCALSYQIIDRIFEQVGLQHDAMGWLLHSHYLCSGFLHGQLPAEIVPTCRPRSCLFLRHTSEY